MTKMAIQDFGAVLSAELQKRIGALIDRPWQEIGDEISREANALLELNAARALDGPAAAWLSRACVVLATFRVLSTWGEKVAIFRELQAAVLGEFEQRMSRYLTERFGLDLERSQEAFDRIAENFQTRGETRFGAAFTYERDVQDEARSFTNIRRCGYDEFFRANGACELTRIFCALDIAWADEVRRRNLAVDFERPTTLAEGGDACRFQFRRRAEASGP